MHDRLSTQPKLILAKTYNGLTLWQDQLKCQSLTPQTPHKDLLKKFSLSDLSNFLRHTPILGKCSSAYLIKPK